MALRFVDLANEALDYLGASPIQDLSDASAEARIAARTLPRVLDRVLRSYPWNCAVVRLDIDAATIDEGDALAHGYALPDSVLRVLDLWPEGAAWRVETRVMPDAGAVGSGEGQPARIIRTDVAGGIRIRAIARPTEPGGLDPLLGGLVSAELAVAMAAKLTENTSRMATLMDFSARLRREAITADAQESSGDDIVSLGLPGGLGGRV